MTEKPEKKVKIHLSCEGKKKARKIRKDISFEDLRKEVSKVFKQLKRCKYHLENDGDWIEEPDDWECCIEDLEEEDEELHLTVVIDEYLEESEEEEKPADAKMEVEQNETKKEEKKVEPEIDLTGFNIYIGIYFGGKARLRRIPATATIIDLRNLIETTFTELEGELYVVYYSAGKTAINNQEAWDKIKKGQVKKDKLDKIKLLITSSVRLGEEIEPIEITKELEEKFGSLLEEMLWIFARATGPIQYELLYFQFQKPPDERRKVEDLIRHCVKERWLIEKWTHTDTQRIPLWQLRSRKLAPVQTPFQFIPKDKTLMLKNDYRSEYMGKKKFVPRPRQLDDMDLASDSE